MDKYVGFTKTGLNALSMQSRCPYTHMEKVSHHPMNVPCRHCNNCKLAPGKECTPDLPDPPTKLSATTQLLSQVHTRHTHSKRFSLDHSHLWDWIQTTDPNHHEIAVLWGRWLVQNRGRTVQHEPN